MGAGVRDAFPPPMCVWIVYAFRLGGLRVGGWCRWGGLCVNGYFVCMGLCGKILRSVVGAVPVCPPVSPHKDASIVHSPCMMRDTQTFFGMETPLPARVALQGRIHRSFPVHDA